MVKECPITNSGSPDRIGSIRQNIYQTDAYLVERVNAGMGEWEYVIQYCGEYYATAPTEQIARDIVERAQWISPHGLNSTELLLIAHDEWKRREERRKIHPEDHWISGWLSGLSMTRKYLHEQLVRIRQKARERQEARQ